MVATVLLAVVAATMAAITAYLIVLAARVRSGVAAAVVLFLLGTMVEMFVAAAFYFAAPTSSALVTAVWGSGLAMAATAVSVFLYALREASRNPGGPDPRAEISTSARRWFAVGAVALVLGSEAAMGAAFQYASGALAVAGNAGNPLDVLGSVLVSPWFVFSMAVEMALTLVAFRRQLPRALLVLLPLQAVIMALTPPALASSAWQSGSSYLSSGLMVALFVFVMEHIYRNRNLPGEVARYLPRVVAAYAVMMVGLFLWLDTGSTIVLGGSVAFEMVLFLDLVLRPTTAGDRDPFPWQLHARWAFTLLSGIFIAELFMGAVLDLQLEPTQFSGVLFASPLTGGPLDIAAAAISNGFWFVADVAASTWFLIMMGVEMGALVVFKFRETRQLETRIRLGLMIGSYAAFAVFFPSIYLSSLIPNPPDPTTVPVLGWSMGIGSAPLAAGVFGVLIATYAITGALVVLFGRRVICSVFCTAPLMYQGTAIDAMKSFQHRGPIAPKYLGSRFSSAYSVTTGVTMGALVAASTASYLDGIGRLQISIGGVDPTIFLFDLSFSVLWYVMFVTIPYTGTYNCVTMGYCYTGTIAAAFQKLGFFKLKVRDRDVCRSCTTIDCARACPVGLVDMPGHFRTKGEFRSSKCCGVGNCVGACPYGNLYISDVRHWLRRRRGVPEVPPLANRLPMVGVDAPRVGALLSGPIAPPNAHPLGSPAPRPSDPRPA